METDARTISTPHPPDWLAQREERESQRSTQAKLRLAQERGAALLIEKYGPEFWRDFLHFLQFNVDALPRIGMSGRVAKVSAPEQGPQIYQVHVRGEEPFFLNTYSTVQFDLSSGKAIHCLAVEGGARSIHLVPSPSMAGIGAIWTELVIPLNAQQTAEQIVQEIVDRINPE
jgi:hypothetical protein